MKLKQAHTYISQRLRQTKIRTRLIIAFLVISLLPSLVLSFLSNHVYSDSITRKTAQASHQTMQLLNNNLDSILEEYSRYIDEVSVSPSIHEFLYHRLLDPSFDQFSMVSDMLKKDSFFRLLYSDPTVRDIFIMDSQGNFVANNGYVSYSPEAVDQVLAATEQISPKDHVASYTPSYGSDCLAMCRKIYDNRFTHTHVGYIILFFDNVALQENTFPISSLGEGSSMFLLNSAGQLVSSQNVDEEIPLDHIESLFSQVKTDIRINGYTDSIPNDDNLVLYTFNKEYNLYIFSFIPDSLLNAEIHWVAAIVLTATCVLLIVCLLLSTLIYRSIIVPIKAIVSVCEHTEGGKSVQLIQDTADDELGYLARTIDAMTQSNQQMIKELQVQDQQKRELEIEMLQYQINPHFLFNTLNTLKWIASINGVSTLSDGISSLANLLRSTLVKKDELVTVRDEISSLKDYCTIQNLRYAGQFNISFFIEPSAQDCQIPRFLLQPLVENAILHGSKHKETILEITVSCHILENTLHISVQDNGVGFSVGDVFDNDHDRFTGIGLSNVDNRLRLYYGEASRLKIITTPGKGTFCRITIPVNPQ